MARAAKRRRSRTPSSYESMDASDDSYSEGSDSRSPSVSPRGRRASTKARRGTTRRSRSRTPAKRRGGRRERDRDGGARKKGGGDKKGKAKEGADRKAKTKGRAKKEKKTESKTKAKGDDSASGAEAKKGRRKKDKGEKARPAKGKSEKERQDGDSKAKKGKKNRSESQASDDKASKTRTQKNRKESQERSRSRRRGKASGSAGRRKGSSSREAKKRKADTSAPNDADEPTGLEGVLTKDLLSVAVPDSKSAAPAPDPAPPAESAASNIRILAAEAEADFQTQKEIRILAPEAQAPSAPPPPEPGAPLPPPSSIKVLQDPVPGANSAASSPAQPRRKRSGWDEGPTQQTMHLQAPPSGGSPTDVSALIDSAAQQAAAQAAAAQAAARARNMSFEGGLAAPAATLNIEQQFIGFVIGQGGETLRHIKDATGVANIQIDQSTKEQGFSTVQIFGHKEGADRAVLMLEARISELDPKRRPINGEFEEIQLEQSMVGFMLGKGGETLKTIKQKSGASISIDQSLKETGYSVIRIMGDTAAKAMAKELVHAKMSEAKGPQPGVYEFKVEQHLVGWIIGKGGEFVRGVKDQTGCTVVIDQASKDSGYSVVKVMPGPGIEQAAEMIKSKLGAVQGSDLQTEDIQVDTRAVGLLIGRGGETVRQIKDQSGASMVIDNSSAQNGFSVVKLGGQPEAVRMARELVRRKLEEFRMPMMNSFGGSSYNNSNNYQQQPQQQSRGGDVRFLTDSRSLRESPASSYPQSGGSDRGGSPSFPKFGAVPPPSAGDGAPLPKYAAVPPPSFNSGPGPGARYNEVQPPPSFGAVPPPSFGAVPPPSGGLSSGYGDGPQSKFGGGPPPSFGAVRPPPGSPGHALPPRPPSAAKATGGGAYDPFAQAGPSNFLPNPDIYDPFASS